MLLARKGQESDVWVIANPESNQFFCMHQDPTRYRMWEPVDKMTGNEMHRHLLMHREIGHKVPQYTIDRCLTLQMTDLIKS